MTRPTDDPKTFRLDLRFPPDLVEEIDEWRRREKDIPHRAEAIRRLCRAALSETKKPTAVPALEKRTAAGPDTHERSE